MHQLASLPNITGTNNVALSSYGKEMPQLADSTFQGSASGGLNVAEQPGGSAASGSTFAWTHSDSAYVYRRPDATPFRLISGNE
jgi:hypothetical protein